MKNYLTMVLAMLLCLTLAGCSEKTEEIVDGGDTMPGGIRPELLVDGRMYYWSEVSLPLNGAAMPESEVYVEGDAASYLPKGYAESGSILSVTANAAPTKDGELKAGFDVKSGTIYTSERTPEAVYVLLTTDWMEDTYVRFISAELDSGSCVAWKGNLYRIEPGYSETMSEKLEELPKGCQSIGQLHFIGKDLLPANDLETNCAADGYSRALEGREAFCDPADPAHLYVYERQFWSEGEYDAYLKCELREN